MGDVGSPLPESGEGTFNMCSPEGDTGTRAQENRTRRGRRSAFEQAKVTTEPLARRAHVGGFITRRDGKRNKAAFGFP